MGHTLFFDVFQSKLYQQYGKTKFSTLHCEKIRTVTTNEIGGEVHLCGPNSRDYISLDLYIKTKVDSITAVEAQQSILAQEYENKRILDSLAIVKKQKQQQEDSLALVQMKKKYMNKTWYYRRGDWQYSNQ